MKHEKKINPLTCLTPADIAKLSGKTVGWIRKCITCGQLNATLSGRQYYVTHQDYKKWLKALNPPGRPKKEE